jgi:hypothetical protein
LTPEGAPPRRRISPAVWEVLAASTVLAWRFRLQPLQHLWRDWVTILCVFWIASALLGRSRAWPYVMGGVMAGLLVLYSAGQLPLTLGVFGQFR